MWVLRISRYWLRIALVTLAVYIALPWIAPTLMKFGLETPARAIYTVYRPFCHQFGFRTFFLYGEQSVYPLADAATLTGVNSFESYVAQSPTVAQIRAGELPTAPLSIRSVPEFMHVTVPEGSPTTQAEDMNFVRFELASSSFIGNDQMGYKMSLCERDIAIYTTIFLVGLLYSVPVIRRRLRPAPLLLFFLLGIVPIGIDGVSQLLGYPPIKLWEPRETLPFFRVLTGITFGGMSGWLGFPYLEQSFQEVEQDVRRKLRAAGYNDQGERLAAGNRPQREA